MKIFISQKIIIYNLIIHQDRLIISKYWKMLNNMSSNLFHILDQKSGGPYHKYKYINFLEKPPPEFLDLSLYPLEILHKTSFYCWKFCKIVWHLLKIPRSLIFNRTLEFPHAIPLIPLEIPCPQTHCLDFFWNSPFPEKP